MMLRSLAGCLTVILLTASPVFAEKRIAFLVGINSYQKPSYRDLKYAERDVEAVERELKEVGWAVTRLSGTSATRAAIEAGVRKAVHPLGKEDVMLVMLCGHGQQIEVAGRDGARRNDAFFCPYDAVTNDPATLFSLSMLVDDILAPNVGRKLLLVDACRDDPDPGRGARGIEGRKISLPDDTAVLFSCTKGQQSFENEEVEHGVFTYAVLQGLRGAASSQGDVTWADLVAYVSNSMASPEMRKRIPAGREQVPIPAGGVTRLVIAKRSAYHDKARQLADRLVASLREDGTDAKAEGFAAHSIDLYCGIVPHLLAGRTDDETDLRRVLKAIEAGAAAATEAERRTVLNLAFTMLTVPGRFEEATLASARSVLKTISPDGFQVASAELEQLPKRPGLWVASARATLLSTIYDPDLDKPLRAAARSLVCDPLASLPGSSETDLSRMELALVRNVGETLGSFQETELQCEEMADFFSLRATLLDLGRFDRFLREDAEERSASLQYRLPGTPVVGLFGRLKIKSGLDAGWESLSNEPVLYLGFWCVSCAAEEKAISRARQLKKIVGNKVRIVVVIAAADPDEQSLEKIREQCGDDLQVIETDNDKWQVQASPVFLLSNDQGTLAASKVGVPNESELLRLARKIQELKSTR